MSALGKLVAVRFRDKRLLKGRTADFQPNREFFHVKEEGAPAPTRVPIENLKAVFFIKSPGRDPSCVDARSFGEQARTEKKLWIEFCDGERMAAWSNSFGSRRDGFYVFPADASSNAEKAYVFRSAITQMHEGEAAEAASREYCASQGSEPQLWESTVSDDPPAGTYRLVRRDRSRGGKRD